MVTNTKFSLRACAAAVALLCLGTGAARAADAVLLNPLFQDHAVLQRDRADPVWGRAKPGTAVTVNELRRGIGLDPIGGGDVLVKPGTTAPAVQPPTDPQKAHTNGRYVPLTN